MSKSVKNIAIIINFLILAIAILWMKKTDFDFEPIIVFFGQILSLIVLIFGDIVKNKFSVKGVSQSKVKIHTNRKDKSHYDIADIKDKSEVRIKNK